MKMVIFGLTISSSWGNGHATLWRGLCRALAARGHDIVFFERDVPYYAEHRDLRDLPFGKLELYADWDSVKSRAQKHLDEADAGIVASFCPDGIAASELLFSFPGIKVFYDLDTPITLERLRQGETVPYIHPRGLGDFDLVLSYTGGKALDELVSRLRARNVAPLYGSVDPAIHRPVAAVENYKADLSYLGTYAQDRQNALEKLLIEPARRSPGKKFLIGGAQYPHEFPWTNNIYFARHVPPSEHPVFFCSSKLTLNVTRSAMAEMGYCPSGRLFEAAACGTALVSDRWEGLENFLKPGSEILIAEITEDVIAALELSDEERLRIARRARERTLDEHTADVRAAELEKLLYNAMQANLQLSAI